MTSNRALDGFKNEDEFVKKLNSNKEHPFWKTINLTDNQKLYFVRVVGSKLSKLTNKKIPCKADVFVSEIDLDINELKSNKYLIKDTLVSYGNHTSNHYLLSSLNKQEQYEEIFKC